MRHPKNSDRPTDGLKAERVQRSDAATDSASADLKAERVQLRARREPPPGWRVESGYNLVKTYVYQDPTAARYAAAAARAVAQGWEPGAEIHQCGRRLTVTLVAAVEGLREVDLLRAALIEERCG